MPLYLDTHKHVPGLTAEAVAGAHARDLEVQGKHSTSSRGNWVWIDAIDYTGDATSAVTQTASRTSIAGGSSSLSTASSAPRMT